MIDLPVFVSTILMEVDPVSYQYAVEEGLYPMIGAVEEFNLAEGGQTVILPDETIEILYVAFNRRLLSYVSPTALDVIDHNWRAAPNEVPRHWLYGVEEPLHQLRLHPPTASSGVVQVVSVVKPKSIDANWLQVLLSFLVITHLARSDYRRNREPLAEAFEKLTNVLLELQSDPTKRTQRR